jgi:2'-5' RNA ligase
MYRLFVAFDFPSKVVEQLTDLCFGVQGVRWVPSDQIHLTVRFIGQVDESQFKVIREVLSEVCVAPFEVQLHGAGYFPPRKKPKVLWVGLKATPELLKLHAGIEHALERVGIPPENRKFHPHVTLGRVRDRTPADEVAPFVVRNSLFATEPIQIDRFILFSSILRGEGAIHRKECEYPLEGPPA